MKKSDMAIRVEATAVFPVAAMLFFLLGYHGHLRFQEMTQLFETGWRYFSEVSSVPGGVSDYIGRFLTQFCLHPAVGAVIIALLLLLLQRCVLAVMPDRSTSSYLLSFIPFILAWTFLCSESALMGAVVALVISLAAAKAVMKINDERIKSAVTLMSSLALYWICGPLSIVFVLVVFRHMKLWTGTAALVLTVSMAFISEQLCQVPVERLVTGVHYVRFRNVFPIWIWLAALSAVSLVFIPSHAKDSRVLTIICTTLTCATLCLPLSQKESSRETTMRYAVLTTEHDWDKIIDLANREAPRSYTAIRCLNLALGEKGLLPQRMFNYVQEGPDCLVSDVTMDFVSDLTTAQIYWELSLVNSSQHFAFEAQENLPDFQKSSACYKLLAKTAAANGQNELAGKYLQALGRSPLHRHWPDGFQPVKKPGHDSGDDSYFFLYDKIGSILGLLYSHDKDNRLALDYLLAYNLLTKNLDAFAMYLPLAGYDRLPKNWQEAWLLGLMMSNGNLDEVPGSIGKDNVSRLESFMKGYMDRASTALMLRDYSDTYWFYHFYRYGNE